MSCWSNSQRTDTMRANAGLCIIGSKVTLVPYEKQHVAKYHGWMADPWILEMTASERLTLEEEYANQQSWREDPKKCTFIVLAKDSAGDESDYSSQGAIDRMAGDVNLFFNDYEDPLACEIEVMIAEPKYRRHGFAQEAVKLLMAYASSELHVTRIYCKINEENHASLGLFNRLGYKECNYVAVFQEYELEITPKDYWTEIVDDVLAKAVLQRDQRLQ